MHLLNSPTVFFKLLLRTRSLSTVQLDVRVFGVKMLRVETQLMEPAHKDNLLKSHLSVKGKDIEWNIWKSFLLQKLQ